MNLKMDFMAAMNMFLMQVVTKAGRAVVTAPKAGKAEFNKIMRDYACAHGIAAAKPGR